MNATIAWRSIFCGFLGLTVAGCGRGEPVPHRVATPEPEAGSDAAMTDASGMPVFGTGDRLLPRELSAEQTTVDALSRIGAPSVPALVAVLRDPDPELRQNAARALARIGPDASEAVPELIAALDDKDIGVRKYATRALGEIGPAAGKAVPALIKELRQTAKAAEQAEKAASKAHESSTGAVPPKSQ